MNRYPLLSKTALIGLLMLLLMIPLAMVRDAISERTQYRGEARQSVARAHAGTQTLIGPVLHVSYTETYTRTVVVDVEKGRERQETLREQRVLTVFPETQDTRSRLTTETRWRGIFPVTVYQSRHDIAGRWVWPGIQPREKGGVITLDRAYVLAGTSDLRGLMGRPELKLGEQTLALGAAPAGAQLPLPLAAALDTTWLQPGAALDFTIGLDLAGTGQLAFVPLAEDNRVSLSSPWPHPSFGGDFLPRERQISAQGFEARWQVPAISTQAQQQFLASGREKTHLESLAVALEQPVDAYRLTERATKYGLMFIVLTFSAFFVLEMVQRWRIHPMQYLMIGAALVLFFLLLLSLSEHLDFALAYLTASAACIALLGFYLRHVLGSRRAGLGMAGLLVALYGVLYGILASEDNALLMGSLLLFGVLAAVMIATRRLDWYSVMGAIGPAAAAPPASAAATGAMAQPATA